MIGVFLKNEGGKLCLAQPPQNAGRPQIQLFHYDEHTHMVTVTYEDGAQETFTQEIAPELRESFMHQDTILVAHLDENSNFEQEYRAPLTR